MVRHIIPETLEHALDELSRGPCIKMAGGTDVMVKHRNRAELPPKMDKNVMYLFNVPQLKCVDLQEDGVHIGGMVPLEKLLNHPAAPQLLKDTILDMASPAIRHVATLAGNIGTASPAGDSLVTLYALDAKIVLASKTAERRLSLPEVITGPGETIIRDEELVKTVIVPLHRFTHARWHKVGGRRAGVISKVAFTGCATVEDGIIQDLRLALGAVHKTVFRSRTMEDNAIGKTPGVLKKSLEEFLEPYKTHIRPIDDQRSNRHYRKRVALNLCEEFINRLE